MRGRRGIVLIASSLALGAGGCGGAHHASNHSAPVSRGPYQWLVPTTGPQPSVIAENRNPGTTAWRLPGPAAQVGGVAGGPIAGYVASQALAPGQLQRIYVSDPAARGVRVRVFRIGWYGGTGGREVLRSARLPLAARSLAPHQTIMMGQRDRVACLALVTLERLKAGYRATEPGTAPERACHRRGGRASHHLPGQRGE